MPPPRTASVESCESYSCGQQARWHSGVLPGKYYGLRNLRTALPSPQSCPKLRDVTETLTACLPSPGKSQAWTKDRAPYPPVVNARGSRESRIDSRSHHLGRGCEQ